ncbi:hypothetical protein D3C83_230570 [compost metagenome]
MDDDDGRLARELRERGGQRGETLRILQQLSAELQHDRVHTGKRPVRSSYPSMTFKF